METDFSSADLPSLPGACCRLMKWFWDVEVTGTHSGTFYSSAPCCFIPRTGFHSRCVLKESTRWLDAEPAGTGPGLQSVGVRGDPRQPQPGYFPPRLRSLPRERPVLPYPQAQGSGISSLPLGTTRPRQPPQHPWAPPCGWVALGARGVPDPSIHSLSQWKSWDGNQAITHQKSKAFG